MLLRCKQTRRYFTMNEEQLYYLQRLLSQIDIETNSDQFFNEEEIEQAECVDIGILLNNHIDSNSIFEYTSERKVEPIILFVKDNIASHLQPISMNNLKFISKLSEFLIESQGISIVETW